MWCTCPAIRQAALPIIGKPSRSPSLATPCRDLAASPVRFPLYYTARGYEHSMRRLASLGIETLALAHRYLWTHDARDALRTGKDAEQTVQDSINVVQMNWPSGCRGRSRRHAGAGFLAVALAATQALGSGDALHRRSSHGAAYRLTGNLICPLHRTFRWLGAPQCASGCRSPVARPHSP